MRANRALPLGRHNVIASYLPEVLDSDEFRSRPSFFGVPHTAYDDFQFSNVADLPPFQTV